MKRVFQAEIGKEIGINGDVYGKYERNEIRPTIEMAVKISEALEDSLDYLAGKADMLLDNESIKRIQDVSKLPEVERNYVYAMLDAFITK
ncbi:helix-turn-helix transcriptional regulator [uncultured Chitinophaga sp.]|jgi:Helix-turn-helix.|uniref:helix-turn-helix domain-containing protein n=1 Tax=uncultured Chitinophaga sp. TaxID=339340 RepID=UPI00261318E1|nr:helix-turn-helix transcriptional regulator [uncultured Chitinophaga sp.]